ncbi:cytochrome P450 [Podospora australis]|uniref:Cytochrome P450 n=1 Tax=Podospora australis TaxID=1536484 RepID=A0AAN7AHH5_9PEZI|nr:cytochrome P450 [Podospora australis]
MSAADLAGPADLQLALQRLLLTTEWNAALSRALLCTLLAWAVWRCWKFTVYPMLHPDEPKELPYLVPVLGHGPAFFKDSNGLLARARQYFSGINEPFALTVFGRTFYVVTHAKHSAEVYKHTEALSFEECIQTLMRFNGSDEEAIQRIYSPAAIDKPGFPNPKGLSVGVLVQLIHVKQLHPGDNMLSMQTQARDWINRKLSLDALAKECKLSTSPRPGRIEVPLYEWTSDYFVCLGQHLYFGDVLDRVDPQYPDAYVVFDELIWKMLYQYPKFLCRDLTAPRDQMIASLERYYQLPPDQRRDQAAWMINAIEDEIRAIGVDDANLAIVVFHLYFAINTNARKTSFWMLTYLLRNPEYMAAFRAETAPAFRGNDLVDVTHIHDPAKCPTVDAIWHETLRVTGWAASVRVVTRDVVVGGKLMRQGNRVMVPHRLLHFDETIFGKDPASWNPRRWLDTDAGRKLPSSPAWRPFGGGRTKCSGRFLAKYAVTAFVATLLRRFDIEAVGNPPMPEPDVGRPVLGIISVKEGYDYQVAITERKDKGVDV